MGFNSVPLFEVNASAAMADAKLQSFLQERFAHQEPALFYVKNNAALLPNNESYLNPTELNEHKGFSSGHRDEQFLMSRWLLKSVVAKFLNIDPTHMQTDRGELGKLFLLASQNPNRIDFNISHTEEFTLLGVTANGQIGVDIEKIALKNKQAEIAKRFFHEQETKWINEAASDKEKQNRFFRIWSMKEAVVKTIGGGVFKNIHQFHFEEKNQNLNMRSEVSPFHLTTWDIKEFSLIPGHVCSVALLPKV